MQVLLIEEFIWVGLNLGRGISGGNEVAELVGDSTL
jgi:hypothetical protein